MHYYQEKIANSVYCVKRAGWLRDAIEAIGQTLIEDSNQSDKTTKNHRNVDSLCHLQ
jgi:hypothetical protein